MTRTALLLLASAAAVLAGAPAFAQNGPDAPVVDELGDEEVETIVVTGRKPEGSVIGDIPPEITLTPGDVRSFGVSSVSELIAELSPQTGSGQGRGEAPVVLLNGKRISGFSEIRDVPTEAIQRVEILPEEVALKYGYRPNQKVVNVVLRRRFNAVTAELEGGGPTEGGQFSPEAQVNYLNISPAGRLNLALKYEHSSALYESERDVPGEDSAFRTLLPETDALTLNAVLARTIFDNVSASFNAGATYNESDSARGLSALDLEELGQRSRDAGGHLGTTLNGALGKWNWTFTGTLDHNQSRTTAERDITTDRARSISTVGSGELIVTGSPFALPAGAATVTATVGGTTSDFDSRSTRSGVLRTADLARDTVRGQISLDLPIASRKRDVLSALGDLTANANIGYDDHSDLGTVRTLGAGVNWSPIKPVSLIASWNEEEGVPTVQQLGNPLVTTNGVRVFDYIRGETVEITRFSGGNPELGTDERRVFKLGMTLKPLPKEDLSIVANYTDSRTRNPIAAFPSATAAIEAAFRDRFVRDAEGRLVSINSRPINFARQDSRQIRWGFNFSKRLSEPPRREGQPAAPPSLREQIPQRQESRSAGARGERAGRGGDGPRGGFGRGGGGRGTRLQLALYHTVHLKDEILIAEGGPKLDLLDGDAIGSGGGQSRHEVQAQAGLTRNGLGARLSANWRSATDVDGGLHRDRALHFSDIATVNLRLFANLGQQRSLVERHPWLRGSRISLSVTNLFNTRQNVRDANGETPLSYRPDYLDPLGRSVRISFRKLFF